MGGTNVHRIYLLILSGISIISLCYWSMFASDTHILHGVEPSWSYGETPDKVEKQYSPRWQPTLAASLFIYTAYLNAELGRITVTVVYPRPLHSQYSSSLRCLLQHSFPAESGTDIVPVSATVREVGGTSKVSGKVPWGTYLVHCNLVGTHIPLTGPHAVHSVALVTHSGNAPSNGTIFIPVSYNGDPALPVEKRPYKFLLCIPVVFAYDKPRYLIEYLEFHKLLGVNKVVIYVQSTSAQVNEVLKYYSEVEQLVEVIKWDLMDHFLPSSPRNIHYYGQNICANDCLYRHRYLTQYLASYDLDEIIVPQYLSNDKPSSWHHMIRSIDSKHGEDSQSIAGYIVNSAFYVPQSWLTPEHSRHVAQISSSNVTKSAGDSPVDALASVHSLMCEPFYRILPVMPGYYRSKYIVRPQHVHMLAIHLVYGTSFGKPVVKVSPEDALVHHYRDEWSEEWNEMVMNYCCPDEPVRRERATDLDRYLVLLREHVERARGRVVGSGRGVYLLLNHTCATPL